MTKDEALKLALDALRSAAAELYKASSYCNTYEVLGNTNDAITAIQQALARADERDRAMRENAYVQAEREACAKTKAGKPRELKAVGFGTLLDEQQFCFDKGWREGAAAVRAAIRARGETK